MTIRYPDSPTLINLSVLAKLDADPPGTWIGTQKVDGRRLMCYKEPTMDGLKCSEWRYRAKNKEDAMPLPEPLKTEFESMAWPSGVGLDVERTGLRKAGDRSQLFVFDLLHLDGQWVGNWPYQKRYLWLYDNWISSMNVFLVEARPNPGLVEYFHEQRKDPLSEGLVVSAADCTIKGSYHRSAESSRMFKVKFER